MIVNSKIVRRKCGRGVTRHGIALRFLAPRHQEVLLNNGHIKEECEDDRYVMILFKLKDDEVNNSKRRKLYVDPETGDVVDFINLKRNFNIIEWNCAICGKKIKSKITDFSPENFLCEKCNKYVENEGYIPDKVLDSAYRFSEHCKHLYKQTQKEFIKYIKKNGKL